MRDQLRRIKELEKSAGGRQGEAFLRWVQAASVTQLEVKDPNDPLQLAVTWWMHHRPGPPTDEAFELYDAWLSGGEPPAWTRAALDLAQRKVAK